MVVLGEAGLSRRLEEVLVFLEASELIREEVEMRGELVIRGVLEEGSRHLQTGVHTLLVCFKLLSLVGQSLQSPFGISLEFFEETLFCFLVCLKFLKNLLSLFVKVGDYLILLGFQGLLYLGLHEVDEGEGLVEVLVAILHTFHQT